MTTLDGVPPTHIFNYDETNLSDDPGKKVGIFKRGTKYPEIVRNFSKGATSLMFCGSAAGKLLPLYVVYKAEHLWDTWCEGRPQNTRYNRTSSGWFDAVCFQDWFKTILLPHVRKLEGPKVVIGDNLSSHFNPEIVDICTENNIRFVMLPPNSTHLTQPLDIAFFAPLKKAWRGILSEFKIQHPKINSLSKDMFPSLLSQLKEAIANKEKENLMSGFRASGIYPLNRHQVLKRLPEQSTSDVADTVAQSVLEHLKEMRGLAEKTNQKKRTRMMVEAGKSIAHEDIEPGTSGSQNTEYQVEFDDNLLPSAVTNQYVQGQWILVKFATKRTVKYFIGYIEEVVSEDEINVKCVKMTGLKTYLFTWPEKEDCCEIEKEQIVKILSEPIEFRRGILKFSEDLHLYM